MLCKAPKELIEERNDYFNTQAKAQISSVDNNLMRENDPRMPLFNDRKSKVLLVTELNKLGSYKQWLIQLSTPLMG